MRPKGSALPRFCAAGLIVIAGYFCRASSAAELYWLDAGADSIQESDISGNNVTTLISGLGIVEGGLAVDGTDGWIYWSVVSPSGNGGYIERATLTGLDPQTVLTDSLGPRGIAVDPAIGKIFWVDSNGSQGTVQEANLDGTSEQTVVSGLVQPVGLALDPTTNYLYWTDPDAEKIQRATISGMSLQTLVSKNLVNPRGITVDVAAQKIYWTDNEADYIGEANTDGTEQTSLLTYNTSDGIVYDPQNSNIYWADFQTPGKIMDSLSDGSNVTPVVTGLVNPRYIAVVVPEPTGLVFAASCLALLLRRRRVAAHHPL
jgi:DNA-binding beta-propeller fold protein YncE